MPSEIFLTEVTERTKKPTGLSITRSQNKFKVSWKIGDKNYGGGQLLKWKTNQSSKWNTIKLGPKVTSKTIELNFSNYIPSTKKALSYLRVEVEGLRDNYTTGSGKKKCTHVMKWSDSSTAVYYTEIPNAPKVTAELDDELNNRCKFTWTTATSDTAKKIFRSTEWQTVLLKNSNITDGAEAFKATRVAGTYETGTSTANNTKTFTEDTSYINQSDSYTRWFRIRARGPKGSSSWVYKKHVYARAYAATDVEAKALWIESGFRIDMTWQSSRNNHRPVDKIMIQYLDAIPGAGMAPPAGATWTDVMSVAYKDGSDGARFVFDEALEDDHCLFVRVVTVHDREETPSEAAIAIYGKLADPELNSVTPVVETHRATINAENKSSVPGSFLAVLFKSDEFPDEEICVGIITGTSTIVQCPDWGTHNVAFGVRACVGEYSPQTRDDGVTAYSVSTIGGMASNPVWDNGQVPVAPDGVSVTRTNTPGTVRVKWNNTWTEADSVELAWADHEDAWESTDPPSTYSVSNAYAAAWNIANLEVGKRWYFRVRLVKGAGESATPGPWSEIVSISLSEAPAIPALALSQPAIPADGVVTASWGYVSGDGTPQAYAEICTSQIVAGEIVYGEVIATVTTPQHIDLYAEELGWAVGDIYNLCVRVGSASGEVSEWSEPNSLMIVPPIEIAITQTSFADYHVVSAEADNTPYLFRPSPALTEDYDRLLLDQVVGGTLAVNQLVKTTDTEVTVTSGHKYLSKINDVQTVAQSNGTAIAINDGTNDNVFDLTQMFGSTIADYVYNLEQSTAGSGVAWLKQYFPSIFSSYQPYNAGTLESVAASEHVMTGFNQFDKTATSYVSESYRYFDIPIGATQELYISFTDKDTSVDVSDVNVGFTINNAGRVNSFIWNMTAGVIKPDHSNITNAGDTELRGLYCPYLIIYPNTQDVLNRLLARYDICINISSDRNGEYEAYTQTSYPLDSTLTLRGVPKLSNGVPYYDGDIYASVGSVNRRYTQVDFADFIFGNVTVGTSGSGVKYADVRLTGIKGNERAVSNKYTWLLNSDTGVDKSFKTYTNAFTIYDNRFTDADTAKNILMSEAVSIVYKPLTPTTETADPYTNPQVCYKGGTEEFVASNVVPVGHETEYAKAYDVPTLTDMPLTVTVTGAGETGETTVAIERAESYYLDRPDERNFTGHEGETIALFSQMGEAQITISNEDLIGSLDDGAPYRLVATVQDGFGQSAEATLDFEVHWAHQAVMPEADVEIDNTNYIAKITPIAPIGAGEGDVCDIYRLSVDRPELIYAGAEFGTTYVDPFPALGEMGGHRIVYRTANGDYITKDNELAWTDYTQEDTGGIDTMYNIIDYENGQVQLMYDITLSSGWDKDFQETKYLGGHIQGDWNPAVSRSGNVGGAVATVKDQETIQAMRRLADSAGICHVRTRDGSSYAADVQVSESRDMGQDVVRAEFTLNITRVDPEGYEAMTLADWTREGD